MMFKRTVSIIGSGPSGFYTAYRILKKSPIPIHVKLWEKLPVPYGLSRYGVAPDHPEVKNCEETFELCARKFHCDSKDNNSNRERSTFEFIGGVEIGKQVKLRDLILESDSVVFSYGCQSDRHLKIEGENNTQGVMSSREIVNWYNGHFDYALEEKYNKLPWNKIKRVGIIGNGNVALDIARVLISNQVKELWDGTDISTVALNNLRQNAIKSIRLIGRRDFIHSKFTNKELRELWELEKYGIKGHISSKYFNMDKFNINEMDRPMKRRIEMCSEYMKPFELRTKKNYKKYPPVENNVITVKPKQWELDYLKTPLRINQDPKSGYIKSLTLCENIITPENQLIPQYDRELTYDIDLLITSLGYKGLPLEEFQDLNIGFDHDHISNVNGKVLSLSGEIIPKLYASGWIRKGSKGVIASTMQDSFAVADTVIDDLNRDNIYKQAHGILQDTSVDNSVGESFDNEITWRDWEKINQEEVRRGHETNKPRSKFLTLDDVIKCAKCE